MRNECVKKLKKSIRYDFLIRSLIYIFCALLLWVMSLTVLRGLFAVVVSALSYDLYGAIVQNLGTAAILYIAFLLIAALVLAISLTLRKTFAYFDELISSVDNVFGKEDRLIVLPAEMKEVENKLNTIKYNMGKSEQAARAAEQRKNDLVVYLAHDLKTPLTSVIGYLSLLKDEEDISPSLREKYLTISFDKAQRLEELINEFFEITRFNLQGLTREDSALDLSLMLEQLCDEFYPILAQKNLRCETSLPKQLPYLGDGDKLARVFDNLLRNAINYSSPDSVIRIAAQKHREQIRITFTNAGATIPSHKLESIFEKFYRLDSARSSRTGGAGLGLAIAKEIVELHGGAIEAQSKDGITTFSISLPSA